MVVVILFVLGWWLTGLVAGAVRAQGRGGPVPAPELLTALAAAAALALVCWLLLGIALEVLAAVPGAVGGAAQAVSHAVTPVAVRRFSALVLGLGVVAGLAPAPSLASPAVRTVAAAPLPDPGFAPPPAFVDRSGREPDADRSSPPQRSGPGPVPSAAGPDPRWLPTAPTVRPQPDVRVLGRPPGSAERERTEVVVQRGDSLWTIAARFLGPEATDSEIARSWPAWFTANRTVIGDDPDVLLPGQVLRAPEVVRP